MWHSYLINLISIISYLYIHSPRYKIDESFEPFFLVVVPVSDRNLKDVEAQLRDTDKWKLSDVSDPKLESGDRIKAQSAVRKQRERLRFKASRDAIYE